MRKIAGCAIEDHNHFVKIIVDDDKMTVSAWKPTDAEAQDDELSKTLVETHCVDPYATGFGVAVKGSLLKDGLEGNFVCLGKATYFAKAPEAANSSTEYYGSGEVCDHTTMTWFIGQGRLTAPVARNTLSYLTKAGTMRMLQVERKQTAVQLVMPFAGEKITSDMNSIQFDYSPEYGYDCNLSVEEFTLDQLQNHADGWSPSPVLTMTGPDTVDPDGSATFLLSLSWPDGAAIDHDSDIYLETTGGYLPHQRLHLTGGKGSFRVQALGLKSGESFKVKAGWRYFSGAAEKTVTVA